MSAPDDADGSESVDNSYDIESEQFLDGADLQVAKLGRTVFGTILLAWASGFISVTQAVGNAWSRVFGGIGGYAASLVTEWLSVAGDTWRAAWSEVPTNVGLPSFFIAVVFVLGVGWLFSQVVDYVRTEVP